MNRSSRKKNRIRNSNLPLRCLFLTYLLISFLLKFLFSFFSSFSPNFDWGLDQIRAQDGWTAKLRNPLFLASRLGKEAPECQRVGNSWEIPSLFFFLSSFSIFLLLAGPESSPSYCLGTAVTVRAPEDLREDSGQWNWERGLQSIWRRKGELSSPLFSIYFTPKVGSVCQHCRIAQRESLRETCFLSRGPGQGVPTEEEDSP